MGVVCHKDSGENKIKQKTKVKPEQSKERETSKPKLEVPKVPVFETGSQEEAMMVKQMKQTLERTSMARMFMEQEDLEEVQSFVKLDEQPIDNFQKDRSELNDNQSFYSGLTKGNKQTKGQDITAGDLIHERENVTVKQCFNNRTGKLITLKRVQVVFYDRSY